MSTASASTAPASSAPNRRRSKGPLILIIAGAAVLVIGVIIGGVGIFSLVRGVSEGLDALTPVRESTSITLTKGDDQVLYKRKGATTPTCVVVGPDGAAPDPGPSYSSEISGNGDAWESFDSFRANADGSYTIACDGGEVRVGPPVSIGGILLGVGGIFALIGGGILGFLLLIGGIIWMVVARRKPRTV